MEAINALLDKAAAKCSPSNDSALAARMHVSRSAVSLWRRGGHIKEKHLTALVVLADVDSATALRVLAEQSETRPEKAVWDDLLKRVGAAVAVVVVAALPFAGHAKPLIGKDGLLSHFAITRQMHIMSRGWRYYAGALRDWLAHRLQRPASSPGCLEARTCL